MKDVLWIITTSGIISYDGNNYKFYNNYTNKEIQDGRFIKVNKNEITGMSKSCYVIDQKLSIPKIQKTKVEIFGNLKVLGKSNYFKKVKNLKKSFGSLIIDKLLNLKTINYNVFFFPTTKSTAYCLFDNNLFFISHGKIKTIFRGDMGEKDFLTFGNYLIQHQNDRINIFKNGIKYDRNTVKSLLGLKNSSKDHIFKTASGKFILLNNNCIYEIQITKGKIFKTLIFSNSQFSKISAIDYNYNQNAFAIAFENQGLQLLRKKNFLFSPLQCKTNSISILNDSLIHIGEGKLFNWKKNYIIQSREDIKPNNTFLKLKFNKTWYQIAPYRIGLFNENNELLKIQTLNTKDTRYHGFIHTLIIDSNGRKWYHTDGNIFYEYIDNKSKRGSFKKLTNIQFSPSETIETIAFINNNQLWIGTNKHLIEYNIKTKLRRILLNNVDLRTIAFDYQGDCWLGTYGQGAFFYRKGRFNRLPVDAENSLLTCHSFLLDGTGHVWVSSDNGLYCIKKKIWTSNYAITRIKNSFVHFKTSSKGELTEFNGGFSPSAQSFKNVFFYSTMDGLIYFEPEKIINQQTKPQLSISKIENDNQKLTEKSTYILKNNFKYLSIDIVSPNWNIDDNSSICYSILFPGEKPYWRYLKNKNQIYISTLPSGNYKIQIKAENKLGKPLTTIKTIHVIVEKSFFESIYFLIILLLFLTVIIIIILRIRQSFLIKERNKLKQQVSNQIENLFETNNKLEFALLDLSKANNKLKMSDEMRAIMTSIFVHDLKAPMKFLTHISKLMFSKNITLNQTEITDLAQNIYITSLTSIQKIDQFLTWQANEQSSLKANLTEFSLTQVLEELELVFSVFCKQNSNQFKIIGGQSIKLYSDLELLKIILWNLIDNANKNTRNGEILLEIMDNSQYVLINIIDSGKGINQDELSKIKMNLENDHAYKSNKNIGLKIVTSFLKLLNGKLEISSQGIHKGTLVRIYLYKTNKIQ
jgi:signal transduction histidine kinase